MVQYQFCKEETTKFPNLQIWTIFRKKILSSSERMSDSSKCSTKQFLAVTSLQLNHMSKALISAWHTQGKGSGAEILYIL